MADIEKWVSSDKKLVMENMQEKKSQANVELITNGPIKITGNFQIKDLKRDKEESPSEIWLCRCGRSQNKPYCDESHKK